MSTFCITLFVLCAQFINVAALVGHVEEDRVFFFFFFYRPRRNLPFFAIVPIRNGPGGNSYIKTKPNVVNTGEG